MIAQGQICGGLTQVLGPALYEEIPYDEDGNNRVGSFWTASCPPAVETPAWKTGHTVTPSPQRPQGANGMEQSATVGTRPAIANAAADALAHLGVPHIDIPIRPDCVWEVLCERTVPRGDGDWAGLGVSAAGEWCGGGEGEIGSVIRPWSVRTGQSLPHTHRDIVSHAWPTAGDLRPVGQSGFTRRLSGGCEPLPDQETL